MSKSNEINMCEGPIFSKILLFALPLIASNILQLLFNAADVVVVGRFAGSYALAAVGSTTSLINLLVNFFSGLSVGANVIVAHYYGAGDRNGIRETVHTAITVAFTCGIAMIFLGILASRPMLTYMGTPDDVINHSVLYMRIYFLGMPALMLYNFGAAILRAAGDTKHPLYYLSLSGVLNVVLNLIFVIVFDMSVAGVALATIISQYLSAVLIIINLIKTGGLCHLELKSLRIHINRLSQILQIGLAAGLQSVAFNISNVQIQSAINTFGSTVMAGSAAAGSIEGFTYMSMNAVSQTVLSFMGQNLGAKKYSRINKILIRCMALSLTIGLIIGMGTYLLGNFFIGIYNSDPLVIESGIYRLSIISTTYAICGIMEVFAYGIRGLGHSTLPMVVSILGACVFRVIWISTVFKAYQTQFSAYISYPISWIITGAVLLVCYIRIRKKYPKEDAVTEN